MYVIIYQPENAVQIRLLLSGILNRKKNEQMTGKHHITFSTVNQKNKYIYSTDVTYDMLQNARRIPSWS